MGATASLHEPLADHGSTITCESVEVRGNVAWLRPKTDDERLVVPLENLAGVAGDTVDQSVEQTPTHGGQYTEVVTRLE